MPVWRRHPCYSLFIVVALAITLLLLNTYRPAERTFLNTTIAGQDLSIRTERAERIYQKVFTKRKGLIEKFGPSPKDVEMFPPNVRPWPAYTVWDFFPAAFNCPHELQRIGSLGDGGKWVCGLSRLEEKEDCIVYSFGINGESTFEAEILAETRHCQIWGYDFSVKSFGPQIPSDQLPRTHFFAYGLSGSDKHGPDDTIKMYTLNTLMRLNGHTHIDILKIDIEGWEFETFTSFVQGYLSSDKPLPFGQLQLEIHVWNKHFPEVLAWWEKLEQAGLRPYMTEPNLVYVNYNRESTSDLAEYSFLNIKGDNIFIKDPAGADTVIP